MTAAIPTIEPAELVAGDTWQWTKSLGDYPAGTWTLTYYFRSREDEFSIVCTASGTNHLASVDAATSAGRKAGRYEWLSVASDGTSRYSIARGTTTLKPDPSKTGAGFDPRSHARKVLEAIEAVLEKRATKDQMRYDIGGRRLDLTPIEDLTKLRDKYRAEVNAEDVKGGGKLVARL